MTRRDIYIILVGGLLWVILILATAACANVPANMPTPRPVAERITKYQVDESVTCYVYNEGMTNASMSCVLVPR